MNPRKVLLEMLMGLLVWAAVIIFLWKMGLPILLAGAVPVVASAGLGVALFWDIDKPGTEAYKREMSRLAAERAQLK